MFERTGAASRRPAGFIEPCLPTKSEHPRNGPRWVHEVKHDGYRLMVRRNGDRVRLVHPYREVSLSGAWR
jgi:ATP-dependent DNA ligase